MAQANVYTDTMIAYFEDSSDARKAVDALQEAGFRSAHLGIAHHGAYTGRSTTEGNTTVRETTEEKGPSTWDKIKSWFGGEEPEAYADERRERDQAQREVIPPTDRFDEGYDDTSDLHGSFTAMNVPDDRARYFSHRFSRNDGRDRETGWGEAPGTVQLLGEVLRVHKDRVKRGDVRIRKEVVTENQSVRVPVQREELVVEHRPVTDGRPATGSIGEQEMRIPLTEERATADKTTVVRDEVRVGKKPVEQVREVGGEVRREELVVEDETKRERSA